MIRLIEKDIQEKLIFRYQNDLWGQTSCNDKGEQYLCNILVIGALKP